MMRWGLGLVFLIPLAACGDDAHRTAVVPRSIVMSSDRRTITVETSYPVSMNCAKEPGGLKVQVNGDVAVVTATMERKNNIDSCTLECGRVTQSVTLDKPLPDGIRFEAPPDADPGCGGAIAEVTTTTLSTG